MMTENKTMKETTINTIRQYSCRYIKELAFTPAGYTPKAKSISASILFVFYNQDAKYTASMCGKVYHEEFVERQIDNGRNNLCLEIPVSCDQFGRINTSEGFYLAGMKNEVEAIAEQIELGLPTKLKVNTICFRNRMTGRDKDSLCVAGIDYLMNMFINNEKHHTYMNLYRKLFVYFSFADMCNVNIVSDIPTHNIVLKESNRKYTATGRYDRKEFPAESMQYIAKEESNFHLVDRSFRFVLQFPVDTHEGHLHLLFESGVVRLDVPRFNMPNDVYYIDINAYAIDRTDEAVFVYVACSCSDNVDEFRLSRALSDARCDGNIIRAKIVEDDAYNHIELADMNLNVSIAFKEDIDCGVVGFNIVLDDYSSDPIEALKQYICQNFDKGTELRLSGIRICYDNESYSSSFAADAVRNSIKNVLPYINYMLDDRTITFATTEIKTVKFE